MWEEMTLLHFRNEVHIMPMVEPPIFWVWHYPVYICNPIQDPFQCDAAFGWKRAMQSKTALGCGALFGRSIVRNKMHVIGTYQSQWGLKNAIKKKSKYVTPLTSMKFD